MFKRTLTVLALVVAPAFAEPPQAPTTAAPKLEGRFAFDVFKPKQKCAKVAGALLTKLTRSYRCTAPDNGGQTGSGVIFVASCKVKKGSDSEYMLFSSEADCTKERETQLANAE